jgi:gamma-glutamyltranspeptidase
LATRQSPGTAIAAGRWALASQAPGSGFDTWNQEGRVRVQIEGHAPRAWDEGLQARGHTVWRTDPFSHGFGHAHVIAVEDDRLAGASDPRARAGAAAGH